MPLARQIAPSLKHNRGLLAPLRKRPDNLNAKQHERLRELFARYPALEPLYHKMRELCDLLNYKNQSKQSRKSLALSLLYPISEMKDSALEPLKTLASTLENWAQEIGCMWRFTKNK